MLRQEYPDLNLVGQFTATRDWALDMLQNQSATVELTADSEAVPPGGNLRRVEVRVTNLTGHKLPDGIPRGTTDVARTSRYATASDTADLGERCVRTVDRAC